MIPMKTKTIHLKPMDPETVRKQVRESYGHIALTASSCGGPGVSCCGSAPDEAAKLAAHIGYGVTSNRFVLRLIWESNWINSGLAFYPDGTLIFSPLMNFQVRF